MNSRPSSKQSEHHMPSIRLHSAFPKKLKKFIKHDAGRSKAVKEAFRRFQADPKHPSLRTEKLSGSTTWTIRVDRGNRLFFTWSDMGDTAIFFFVGAHDAYRRAGR